MNEEITNKVKKFLEIEGYNFSLKDETEQIKEICVAKLCEVLGISCVVNYKNKMFEIFSSVMAEAIYQKLEIKKHIASDNIRLVKYNGVNFVEKAKEFLDIEDIEEATLDIFNFVDENKNLLLENN